MSSLANQLKKLSTPGQLSFRSAHASQKPSLLFTSREAADLDIEAVFSLGVNGLEELKSMNAAFSKFEVTLFSESSKHFERSLQTKEANEQLDEDIERFLLCLSPYILLRPAQKALEWLIRAYRVHACNVDALVACILPYHDTKLFSRVAELLPLNDPSSRWHWLRPVQQSGVPLPRATLLQQCLSVSSFLDYVCQLVPKALEVTGGGDQRVLVAFYTSTIVALLQPKATTKLSESLLARLIPSIIGGLKSSNAGYKAGSYMIVGQLVARATLDEKVVCTFVEVICKVIGVFVFFLLVLIRQTLCALVKVIHFL